MEFSVCFATERQASFRYNIVGTKLLSAPFLRILSAFIPNVSGNTNLLLNCGTESSKSRPVKIRFTNFILILLIAVFSSVSAFSQQKQYNFAQINNTNGLSNNHVTCILRDKQGFMWFGTTSGLNRYDGYSFKVFTHNPSDSTSIDNNIIAAISEDCNGKLWVRTQNGFNVYDPKTETFSFSNSPVLQKHPEFISHFINLFTDSENKSWLMTSGYGVFRFDTLHQDIVPVEHLANKNGIKATSDVIAMAEDSKGNLWLIHQDGYLEMKPKGSMKAKIQASFLHDRYPGEQLDCRIFIDKDDDIWISTQDHAIGLFYYEPATGKLVHIDQASRPTHTNTNIITGITQDSDGNIWIATDHGGINLLDKKDFTIRYLTHETYNVHSIAHNSVTAMFRDSEGIIWIGTYKEGISYYHKNLILFNTIRYTPQNEEGLNFGDINCFAEDKKGNLWIGTNGGGLNYYNRKTGKFTHYVHHDDDPNSLSNDVIVSLFIDHENKLWIGTYFGGLNRFDGKKFTHYTHNPKDSTSISDNNIWSIFEDSFNNLWIGTLGGGLDRFNRDTESFQHFRTGGANSIVSNVIISLVEDKQNRLWIGTPDGLSILNTRNQKFSKLLHNDKDTTTLSSNTVNCLLADSRGWIWVGTPEGLNVYDEHTGQFRRILKSNGLPTNNVVSIVEDQQHNIWLGTIKGLVQIFVKGDQVSDFAVRIKQYDDEDGLQAKEFNERAAYVTRNGQLFFGGPNGINFFSPENLIENKNTPKVVFTNLQVFNQTIRVGEKFNRRVLLPQSVTDTKEITLKHAENFFSVAFSTLSYFHPEKNQFAYKLEGFNNSWIYTDWKNRRATFTNLDPGEYTLRVRASNNNGYWNQEGATLKINILPPFWQTIYAYVAYVLIILLIIWLWRQRIIRREHEKFEIEREKIKARRLHDLDMLKLRFFTNISHEFRTPLTLIITPIEQLLQKAKDNDEKKHLQLIYRNSRRLLSLVNQLLDFRKLEFQEIKLRPSEGEIVSFIRETTESFSDLSEKKNIHLYFQTDVENVTAYFDHDKLEKILLNLLSNAFKYTSENGDVHVAVRLDEKEQPTIEISISDTGIGIPEEKQQRIFERFFQDETNGSDYNQGSGIGLALVNEYVKLQNGTITVESEPGKGSCFRVTLPLVFGKETSAEAEQASWKRQPAAQPSVVMEPETAEESETTGKPAKSTKPVLLLVEDNEDFRFYLKDNFKLTFEVLEAGDGHTGWEIASKSLPDLIISDVMMPVMDGIELCRKVKTTAETSHIPVILLTAKVADNQKMEGFDVGADDYITKPFNFKLLESRIKNLLAQRRKLQKAFRKKIDVSPSEIEITSLDEIFIQKAIDLVEKNIANSQFSVQEMSSELGMSRVNLYKKISSLTGQTPVEFIRTIRLKRAAQFLKQGQLTVSEVAYRVGYNDPKYFARQFKNEFSITPSQYGKNGNG
ncbi:hybrid sensor histidine kinase/response regulator transcription factor [Prolixibacter denitrificans]|uniref:histidine kinase n=1 Tax=Prolixibacter denitrificans TaxID=1541063 RepID=A0A2P8C7H2_9BACT|nr:signal transduction histidine kinase [Prolixibacter denitrificans]